ncbi:hypothetical protein AB0395_29390 [Streptosporangium sp. NPDC051023]|uniref:hypothetical protein n=1 Tax=Streptosporangium sp. NPDC051023 TaxID=3155410 RepID=UPI00344E1A3D
MKFRVGGAVRDQRGEHAVRYPLQQCVGQQFDALDEITPGAFVSFFGQHLGGFDPLPAGFLGAALAAGWTVGSMLSAGRAGQARQLMAIAPLVSAIGLTGLALSAHPEASLITVLLWVVLLFVAGSGVGIAWPHMMTTVMSTGRTPEEKDTASASITTVQLIATALGASLAGTVTNLAGIDGDAYAIGTAARWLYGTFAVIVFLGVLYANRIVPPYETSRSEA